MWKVSGNGGLQPQNSCCEFGALPNVELNRERILHMNLTTCCSWQQDVNVEMSLTFKKSLYIVWFFLFFCRKCHSFICREVWSVCFCSDTCKQKLALSLQRHTSSQWSLIVAGVATFQTEKSYLQTTLQSLSFSLSFSLSCPF